jgi:hypothetical protein
MKKNRSRKSRDTVPFSAGDFWCELPPLLDTGGTVCEIIKTNDWRTYSGIVQFEQICSPAIDSKAGEHHPPSLDSGNEFIKKIFNNTTVSKLRRR